MLAGGPRSALVAASEPQSRAGRGRAEAAEGNLPSRRLGPAVIDLTEAGAEDLRGAAPGGSLPSSSSRHSPAFGSREGWSPEYEDALRAAVKKHGDKPDKDRWLASLRDPEFWPALKGKSADQLRAKWIRLERGMRSAHPWKAHEVAALLAGVAKHGPHWSKILRGSPELSERSPGKLKDKHEQLQRLKASAEERARSEASAPAARASPQAPPQRVSASAAIGPDFDVLSREQRYLANHPELMKHAEHDVWMKPARARELMQRYAILPVEIWGRFDIDHIVPKDPAGLDHPSNYFLLERALNQHFKHNVTPEKRRVIGKDAFQRASAFAKRHKEQMVAAAMATPTIVDLTD